MKHLNNCFRNWSVLLSVVLLAGGFASPLYGQKIVKKSDESKPEWLSNKLPRTSNNTFYYQVTESNHKDINQAREACLLSLSTFIKQTNTIQGGSDSDIMHSSEGEYEKFTFTYQIAGEKVQVTSQKVDEYWEYVSYPNGTNEYRCFTLFAVAHTGQSPNFDKVSFSRKYGARGMLRSMVVPGWGQIYKGSVAKGSFILGGEVALVAGVIYTEGERANYKKKIKRTQNVEHIRSYTTRSENFETARNICIGAAAALYVYNVVDALTANGKKRTIVKKNHLTFAPVANDKFNGVSLCYNF